MIIAIKIYEDVQKYQEWFNSYEYKGENRYANGESTLGVMTGM